MELKDKEKIKTKITEIDLDFQPDDKDLTKKKIKKSKSPKRLKIPSFVDLTIWRKGK